MFFTESNDQHRLVLYFPLTAFRYSDGVGTPAELSLAAICVTVTPSSRFQIYYSAICFFCNNANSVSKYISPDSCKAICFCLLLSYVLIQSMTDKAVFTHVEILAPHV